MMSIFHISNTNGGIRDPVVHLEQKSRVMETWEGNEWICLYNISSLLIIGLLGGYKLLARRRRNKINLCSQKGDIWVENVSN